MRQIEKETQEAVETLVKLLKSQDEKVRMAAADKLLSYQVAIAESVNKDEIQRLLLEVKHTNNKYLTEDDDDTPVVDFDTMQRVN